MSPPPSPTPEAWAAYGDFTRLVILQQRDTDPDRRQAAATHLANIGPYVGAGADMTAATVIARLYAAEAAALAGTPPPPATLPVPETAARLLAEAEAEMRALIERQYPGAAAPQADIITSE